MVHANDTVFSSVSVPSSIKGTFSDHSHGQSFSDFYKYVSKRGRNSFVLKEV